MATHSRYTDKKIIEIMAFYVEHGEQATLETYGIQSSTLNRTRADFNRKKLKLNSIPENIQKIMETYSPAELDAIAAGANITASQLKIANIHFSGKKFKFLFCTDLHAGSKFFPEQAYFEMVKEAKKQKVEAVFISGDITEGMSNRPGHIYDLSHIGAHEQREYAIKLLSEFDKPLYLIDGNHDRWFIKSSGTFIVADIAKGVKNCHFLGHDVGDIKIKNTKIQLWHGEDGNSYAISYRIQKVIEAMPGGGKPNVLLLGHTHKMGNFFIRNVHAISGGSVCLQTNWMRGKRIEAHPGFWIVEITVKPDGSVSSLKTEWFPFYL